MLSIRTRAGSAMNRVVSRLSALLLATSLIGCTVAQQDALLIKVTDMGRDKIDTQVERAQAGDVELSYLLRRAEGPAVVMVHGFSANKDAWLRFADFLPEHYTLVAPDLAGHGDSDTAESYDLEVQAERLHSLLTQLDLGPVHMVGNSMGGAISLLYASKYPQGLASLTLMDSAGLDGANQSEYFAMLEQGTNPLIATDKASFEFRMDMVMEKPPMLPWPLRPALMRQTVERAELNREIFADMLATRERLATVDFVSQIQATVSTPTLIMWGDKDRVLDVSAVETFKQAIPDAKVHIFEGIGHVPMLEVPEDTANVIDAFIQSVPGAG